MCHSRDGDCPRTCLDGTSRFAGISTRNSDFGPPRSAFRDGDCPRPWPERPVARKASVSAEERAVELHVVSDATGRDGDQGFVAATEAQFPDQPFTTVRHPRAETVADLQLVLARMEGAGARVAIFTRSSSPPFSARAMRRALARRRPSTTATSWLQPLAAVAKVSGAAGRACGRGARPAARRELLQADRRDRVRREERRRARPWARRRRRRAISSASPARRRRRSRSTSAISAGRRPTSRW